MADGKYALEVCTCVSLMQNKQFKIAKEKILNAACKLMNTDIADRIACAFFNMCLTKKVHFSFRVKILSPV